MLLLWVLVVAVVGLMVVGGFLAVRFSHPAGADGPVPGSAHDADPPGRGHPGPPKRSS
jgi:hypothetical protein